MTKKEMFAIIITQIEKSDSKSKNEMIDFLNHEIELLERKSSKSTPTKTQRENEILIAQLEDALKEFENPITITDFMQKSSSPVATLSNQKISSLLKKCVDERKTVVRTMEKKRAYYCLIRD
jgi:hypothetical protein